MALGGLGPLDSHDNSPKLQIGNPRIAQILRHLSKALSKRLRRFFWDTEFSTGCNPYLLGGFQSSEKYYIVKLHFPKVRGENIF